MIYCDKCKAEIATIYDGADVTIHGPVPSEGQMEESSFVLCPDCHKRLIAWFLASLDLSRDDIVYLIEACAFYEDRSPDPVSASDIRSRLEEVHKRSYGEYDPEA